MKKLLSVVFAFVLIFSCFAVCASANDYFTVYEDKSEYSIFESKQPIVTFSDDYQKFYMDGEPFSRVDISSLTTDFVYSVLVDETKNEDYYLGSSVYIEWTDKQKAELKDIIIDCNEQQTLFRIELYYKDGSSLTTYFLKDTLRADYDSLISGNVNEYIIDFVFPDGNIVIAQKNALFGEVVALSSYELADWSDTFTVCAKNGDGSLMACTGDLLKINENFYYVDYAESDVEEWFLYEEDAKLKMDKCIIHKITDEKLVADLRLALEKYYGDDYGVLYDDNATDSISTAFLIIIFAVIPFIIFVFSIILAIRKKGTYRKIFTSISALCIAEIIVFIIIAAVLTSAKPSDNTIIGGSDDAGYVQIETDIGLTDYELYMN